MKERRGLFEAIFGKKTQDNKGYTEYKLLNSYQSNFIPFSGNAWEVSEVRAAVHSFARRAATVQPRHIRRGDGKMLDVESSSLNNILTPNNRSESADTEDKEYRSAWLKSARRLELTDSEQRALTTAANSVGSVIPKMTRNKIVEKVSQFCPMLDKIDLLRVPGGVTIPAEGTTVDAKTHSEGAAITADADTITNVVLSAFEITKLVTISKSVEKMSIDAFENWLTTKIFGLRYVRRKSAG